MNHDAISRMLRTMTLEQKAGQLLMIPPCEITIRKVRPGSVIVMDGDVDDDMSSARDLTTSLQMKRCCATSNSSTTSG